MERWKTSSSCAALYKCVFFIPGENANISYSLLPGPGYELFTIDSHAGLISTSTQLDRELQHSFSLRGEIFWVITALRINHHDVLFKIPAPLFHINITDCLRSKTVCLQFYRHVRLQLQFTRLLDTHIIRYESPTLKVLRKFLFILSLTGLWAHHMT